MRLLAAFALFFVAGCGDAAAPDNARVQPSIVSLNPCADAILAEVAEPWQLLAISHYSQNPASSSMDITLARQYPVTGGTVEEVLALRPDVVVAGSFLNPAARTAFETLGVRVETIGIASTVAESEGQIRALALLAGRVGRGEVLVGKIEEALAAAAPANGAAPVSALLWQPGGLVAGEDALVSELLRRTGFTSHSAARGLGQGAYLPLEQLLADPPELILSAGGERMLEHPALDGLDNVAVAAFEPGLLFCGGPTIIRAAGHLAAVRQGIGA